MKRRIGPYVLEGTRKVYENPWITVTEDRVIRPGGSKGVFGVVNMVPGSSVLPVDSTEHVFLVMEYKYGVRKESLEVISGALGKWETPLQAAKRELAEEIGAVANVWTDLGCVHPFTTVVRSPNHMFLAQELTFGLAAPDAGEELHLVKMKFSEAWDLVMNGKIVHAASCVLILKAASLLGFGGVGLRELRASRSEEDTRVPASESRVRRDSSKRRGRKT